MPFFELQNENKHIEYLGQQFWLTLNLSQGQFYVLNAKVRILNENILQVK